jgi:hypothetical protein
MVDHRRWRSAQTVVEMCILRCVEENPHTSVHEIQATEHVAHTTVWQILYEQLLYLYHLQQALSLLDFRPHQEFC